LFGWNLLLLVLIFLLRVVPLLRAAAPVHLRRLVSRILMIGRGKRVAERTIGINPKILSTLGLTKALDLSLVLYLDLEMSLTIPSMMVQANLGITLLRPRGSSVLLVLVTLGRLDLRISLWLALRLIAISEIVSQPGGISMRRAVVTDMIVLMVVAMWVLGELKIWELLCLRHLLLLDQIAMGGLLTLVVIWGPLLVTSLVFSCLKLCRWILYHRL